MTAKQRSRPGLLRQSLSRTAALGGACGGSALEADSLRPEIIDRTKSTWL
jgi:hypothetical protein